MVKSFRKFGPFQVACICRLQQIFCREKNYHSIFQLQVCFDDSGLAGRSSASLERLLHRTALLVGCPRVLPPQDLQTQDRARGEVLDLSGRGYLGYTASATILGLGC